MPLDRREFPNKGRTPMRPLPPAHPAMPEATAPTMGIMKYTFII